jgi:hypothetical protein
MRTVACLGLLLALPLSAAETFDPAGRALALAPLIEEETIALVRIDFTRADADGLAKTLSELVPSRKGDLADLAGRVKAFQADFRKAGGTELIASFSTGELPTISFVSLPLKEGADIAALTDLLRRHLPAGTVVEKRDSALLAGSRDVLKRLAEARPSVREGLAEAIKAAGDTAVQVLLLPTAHQRRVIDEVLTLPLSGASARVLTRGVRWAALGADVGAKPKAELTIQSADAAAAKKLADLTAAGIARLGEGKLFGEQKPIKEMLARDFEAASRALAPKVAGSRVTLRIADDEALRAVASLAGAIEERGGPLERTGTGRHFHAIGIALWSYFDAHGTFPAHAIYSKDGKPLLSWRVALLPYLGEDKLFKQFHRDEPWDSEHNKKLIDRMPEVYRSPKLRDRRPGLTTYLAPINKDFVFTGTKEGIRGPRDIPDGTSNTAYVVDASDEKAVVWTKPEDLMVDRKDPWKDLLGHYPSFIVVGTADGGALRVPRTLKPEGLWALFTRAGGEVLPDLSR